MKFTDVSCYNPYYNQIPFDRSLITDRVKCIE